MSKRLLKISGFVFSLSVLAACSGISEKNIEYNSVKSMPGYGYIAFDFSKSNEINYGRGFTPGKASYSISYVNDHDFLSVKVDKAEFDGRILKAYVPYMNGYRLYSVSRLFWYPLKMCNCSGIVNLAT